jgi:quinoprotein glucose dehydrogenase
MLSEKRLLKFVRNTEISPDVRVQCLNALSKLDLLKINLLHELIRDKNSFVKQASLKELFALDEKTAVEIALKILEKGNVADSQHAIVQLSKSNDRQAIKYFRLQMKQILNGSVTQSLMLEILDGAKLQKDKTVRQLLTKYDNLIESIKDKNIKEFAKYIQCMEGGNVKRGKFLFFNSGGAECIRCHKLNNVGGEAGPDLSLIGNTGKHHILESIVVPSAKVTGGYGITNIELKDNTELMAILMKEDKEKILIKIGGNLRVIFRKDLKSMSKPLSPMPPYMTYFLTPAKIRDIVAYLSSLNKKPTQLNN